MKRASVLLKRPLALRRGALGPRALALLSLLAATASLTSRADDAAFTSTAGVGNMGGAALYEHLCQGCHMAQGQGAVGAGHYPRLAGDPALVSWQYVAITVLNGKNGMPPFGLAEDEVSEVRAVHLSDEQVAGVVNYVRTSFGNKYPQKATAKSVAALPHPAPLTAP